VPFVQQNYFPMFQPGVAVVWIINPMISWVVDWWNNPFLVPFFLVKSQWCFDLNAWCYRPAAVNFEVSTISSPGCPTIFKDLWLQDECSTDWRFPKMWYPNHPKWVHDNIETHGDLVTWGQDLGIPNDLRCLAHFYCFTPHKQFMKHVLMIANVFSLEKTLCVFEPGI
jgi:hypothetical protein